MELTEQIELIQRLSPPIPSKSVPMSELIGLTEGLHAPTPVQLVQIPKSLNQLSWVRVEFHLVQLARTSELLERGRPPWEGSQFVHWVRIVQLVPSSELFELVELSCPIDCVLRN